MSRPRSILSWFGKSRSEHPRGRKASRRAVPRPTATARAGRRAIPLVEALEDRLAPTAAATATVADNVSTRYSAASKVVTLSASVTSAAGTVNGGSVTFTILNGTQLIGSAASGTVSAGSASASYTLPAGTAPATYIIQAAYNGTANFLGSADSVLYVANYQNSSTIERFSASGQDLGAFQSGLPGPYIASVDQAGNLYVTNGGGDSVDKFSPQGTLLLAISTTYTPAGVLVGADGTIYVTDYFGGNVFRYSSTGQRLDPGPYVSLPISRAVWMAFDSQGNLYVTDWRDGLVRWISPAGIDQGNFLTNVPGIDQIAFDSQGNIYATSSSDGGSGGPNAIHKYSATGTDLGRITSTGSNYPYGLALDPSGVLYVTYYNSNAVHRFSPTGADLGVFANTGLNRPSDLAFSPAHFLTVGAPLKAASVVPTPTGFTATFNQPLNVNVLSLIDTTPSTFGPADVTLVGQNVGPVSGSLVVSPDGMTITFVKTAGLLAPDTYTLTLRSAADGFVSTTGNLLAGDGIPGDNLVSTFTVSAPASNAVVVSIPNFARGYGQPVNVPASGNAGLPIILSTGQNVSRVDLTLHYNPALLTLSGFTTAIAGASAAFSVPTPGTAVLSVSSATQFSSSTGPLTLGGFSAAVPAIAPYGLKEVLDITGLSVYDNSATPQPLPAVAQDGVHVAAYFGDLNGDQQYSAQDVTLDQRIIGLLNSGFPAYQVADPVLLGDVTLNGAIQANDTTLLQREVGQINVPNIPALPTGLSSPPSGGPDPEVFIPNVRGNPGDTVSVPVRLTVTEAAGITVSGFQVALAYDPSTFTVGGTAVLGSAFAAAGFAGLLTFPAPGQVIFTASSATGTGTIPVHTTADLFTLSLTVAAGARKGAATLNLLNNIQTTPSALFANDAALTRMTLSPAPTNGATDPVDGTFFIGATPPVVSGVVVNGDSAALAGAQRSLVRSLVYTFDQPVTLAIGAFTIALHQNVTVNGQAGQTVGTLPALSWSTPDGGVTWAVTFSGSGVVNGSIADGVYDLTLHAADVTDAAGLALAADRVDTFYRLFGDVNGDGKVSNSDLAVLSAAFNKHSGQSGYLAYLDYDGSGRIDNGDLAQFANRFNTSFGGF